MDQLVLVPKWHRLLNGVDLSCMNSITGSTCRAKCSNSMIALYFQPDSWILSYGSKVDNSQAYDIKKGKLQAGVKVRLSK